MAITVTKLASDVIATPISPQQTTTSVSPADNTLILFSFELGHQGTADPSSVVFNGSNGNVSMVKVDGQVFGTGSSAQTNVSVWRMMGTNLGSGKFTVTFTGLNAICVCTVLQFTGVKTTGTQGADAIVQHKPVTHTLATSFTMTLTNAITSGNSSYAFVADGQGISGATAITGDANWTDLYNLSGSGYAIDSQWVQAGRQSVVDTSGVNTNWGGVIIELGAPLGATGNFFQFF